MIQQTLTLHNEQTLMRRLRDFGAGVLDSGVTTPEERRERVRRSIQELGLAMVTAWGRDKKAVSFADAFERLYGVKLSRGVSSKSAVKTMDSGLSQA